MNRLLLLMILILLNMSVKAQTPWLHVSGNQIQDPAGNKVILRGVALQDITGQKADPTVGLNGLIDKLSDTTNTEAGVNGWYTKIVRFTVNPPVTNFQTYYTNVLKPAVDHATSRGLYVIIDYHYISSVGANIESTNQFWTFMAPKFKNYSNVLYEIYNEPIDQDKTWDTFKPYMQSWVNLIRKYAPHNLILVGSPSWDQVMGGAATNPVLGNNLVYVAHVYPGQFKSTYITGQVEKAAAAVPVFLSEWGFSMTVSAGSQSLLGGTVAGYGDPIMTWAEGLGLSWTAWCADNDWEPAMFTSNWVLKTGGDEMGQFVKQKLYDLRKSNQPSDIQCLPPFLGADQTICSDVPVSIETGYSSTGKTFKWYKDNVEIIGETGPSLAGSITKGNYKVELDSNGCIMSDDINVVDTLFNVSLIPDAVLSDSITLIAGDNASGYSYVWSKDGTVIPSATSDSLRIFDVCKTTFKVDVSYTGCGTKSDSFNILCAWEYFLGHPMVVPGFIQAEDYDIGNIPNTTFHDSDPGNNGGAYRNDAVDIEVCHDGATTNNYNVGWIDTGEFLKYSIDVQDPGTCGLVFRVASNNATGGQLHLDVMGTTGTRSSSIVNIPYTGGWQTWQWVIYNTMDFLATDTMIRVYFDAGSFNLNYIEVRKGAINGIKNPGHSGSSLSVFPNPANDVVHFSEGLEKYNWKIYNTIGEQLLDGFGEKADVSFLQKGQYILVIEGEAYKIVKW